MRDPMWSIHVDSHPVHGWVYGSFPGSDASLYISAGEPQPRQEEHQKYRRERKSQDEDEEGQVLVSSGLFYAESLCLGYPVCQQARSVRLS